MRFFDYLMNPDVGAEFHPAEAQSELIDMLTRLKTEKRFRRAIWAQRDAEQNERNRERRRTYALPLAEGAWTPKLDGVQPAKAPLTAPTELFPANVRQMRKVQT